MLAGAVRVELDGAGRDETRQVRAKASKQCSPAFDAWDGKEDLKGLTEVKDGGAEERERFGGGQASESSASDKLRLVEVGLQSSLEDVQRCCEEGRCHATDTAKPNHVSLTEQTAG